MDPARLRCFFRPDPSSILRFLCLVRLSSAPRRESHCSFRVQLPSRPSPRCVCPSCVVSSPSLPSRCRRCRLALLVWCRLVCKRCCDSTTHTRRCKPRRQRRSRNPPPSDRFLPTHRTTMTRPRSCSGTRSANTNTHEKRTRKGKRSGRTTSHIQLKACNLRRSEMHNACREHNTARSGDTKGLDCMQHPRARA